MKRKIFFLIWLCSFCLICFSLQTFSSIFHQGISETTICNVTEKTQRYSINPVNSDKKPIKKIIKKGAIEGTGNLPTLMSYIKRGRRKKPAGSTTAVPIPFAWMRIMTSNSMTDLTGDRMLRILPHMFLLLRLLSRRCFRWLKSIRTTSSMIWAVEMDGSL